jgi:glycosyltransferase involved in cell wall biosynthesis
MARVVHVCPRYSPARGGVELFFAKLSEALADRGDAVSVWTTDATTVREFTSPSDARLPPGPEWAGGVEIRRFPVRHVPLQRWTRTGAHLLPFGTRWKCDTLRWTPWVPSLTRTASRPNRPVDLVHAAGLPYSSLLFAAVQLADRTGARLVISPFTHIAPPGRVGARMRRAYLSPLNLRLLRRADRVFVQTRLEGRVLADAGVPAARQTLVGLGVDPRECTGGNRERARAAWRVPSDGIVVGHLGNKSWDKGTVDLLDAAERQWAAGLRFTLVLAGAEMPSFSRRWASARFPDRVVNLAALSDEARRDFLAGIDVFALPSYVESFGLSPLEAALNGAAVLAYDHGGPSQVFQHEKNALLAPVGDVETLSQMLQELIRNDRERARLAHEAGRLASGYTWPRALAAALSSYDTLLRADHTR